MSQVGLAQEIRPDPTEESTEAEPILEEEAGITFEFSLDFKSAYIDVNGYANSRHPVVQTDLTITFPNDVYIDFWHSAGIDSGLNSGYDDEFDFYVGWATEFGDGFNFDVNLAYFNIFPLDTFRDEDALQLAFEVSKDFEINEELTLSPYVRSETLFSLEWESIQGETYLYGGLGLEWTLGEDWSLESKGYILYDPGIYELDSGFIAALEGSLNWSLSDDLTWKVLMAGIFTPLTAHDERETEEYIGTGFGWTF